MTEYHSKIDTIFVPGMEGIIRKVANLREKSKL